MKLSNPSSVPVYTISGSSTARPLPEWLARKRRRSLKNDPDYANRIELLQDFEFEEASQCVRASEDGEWVVSTGTYKPQIHVHYLPHLSLSFARHTDALNQKFELLGSGYEKQLHLQGDRSLQFHTPGGCHYTTRIPRYGRDLKYDRRSAEALVPAVGVDADGMGEVYRLNLELGRFMKSYSVDVGGDDMTSAGGGALQGGIRTGAVNAAAVAEYSHGLCAFGTSIGTVEFWDPRARSRVGILAPALGSSALGDTAEERAEITALEFSPQGLNVGVGDSNGIINLYDLRSPLPLLKKDQGYGFPIQNLIFLSSPPSTSSSSRISSSEPKILSADKRIIKIWDQQTGDPWTSVEPAVDLHDVTWCRDSGMLLTANEGRQQHSFFIPQLGPAPKWCAFLDNLVEEMAEDADDPAAFTSAAGTAKAGEVYDNYKFVTLPQLRTLNLDHLIGRSGLLRPYMHGFFVAQQLYEEARLISNPEAWIEQRQKSIRAKIDKERESRIRGGKGKEAARKVKVNRALAERLIERDEKNERRKAQRALKKAAAEAEEGGENMDLDNVETNDAAGDEDNDEAPAGRNAILSDPRFSRIFEDEDFAVDENSAEFRALNPATAVSGSRTSARGLTAAQEEELSDAGRGNNSSDIDSDSDNDTDNDRTRKPQQKRQTDTRFSTASYRTKGHERQEKSGSGLSASRKKNKFPQMAVSQSSSANNPDQRPPANMRRDKSFGQRVRSELAQGGGHESNSRDGNKRRNGPAVTGEQSITFSVGNNSKKQGRPNKFVNEQRNSNQGRRSASNNTLRSMGGV